MHKFIILQIFKLLITKLFYIEKIKFSLINWLTLTGFSITFSLFDEIIS